ncbi:MAG TPA: hypothetical protein VGR57_13460 [Ktedonobacterales bacterium]|nr:hypothetical protein [Ktedonobacterales bacterium]
MREPDSDPARLHGPPARLRWPERVADALKGVPLAIVAMLFFNTINLATRLPLPLEVAVGVADILISLLLVAAFEVNVRRAGQNPRPRLAIALEIVLLLPTCAGATLVIEAGIFALLPNVPEPPASALWAFVVGAIALVIGVVGLISWLIIVIARRATAYIQPASPPAA